MAAGAAGVGWVVVLTLVLRHAVFVSHDTVSNYAHVWYVAGQIWHAHRLPFMMPVLGHGQALAFPYAFIPWVTAALAWPLFGVWTVTLWLVLGFAGVVVATLWAFPELRRGWWLAAALVNPALVLGVVIGQLPFLWAAAFLLAAMGCWRRDRKVAATALAALAQITHPAVVLPITAGCVAIHLLAARRDPNERRSLVGHYLVSLVAALPAAVLVLVSPVFRDSSTQTKLVEFAATVGMRAILVAVPVGLVLVARRPSVRRWVAPVLFTVLLVPSVLPKPMSLALPWHALVLGSDTKMMAVIDSPAFVQGATYRVLRAYDGKMGMYQLIQHGARLDSELFPESINRRSWPDEATYVRFLRHRRVDYVVAFADYTRRYGTNEIAVLQQAGPCIDRVATGPGYELFKVATTC